MLVMMLTTIVIAMGYWVLAFMGKSYLDFRSSGEGKNEISTCYRLLQKDIAYTPHIWRTSTGIACTNNDSTIVQYDINNDYIIRKKNTIIDTFHIACPKWETQYQNIPISSPDKRIDYIQIDISYKEQILPIIIHKLYTAADNIQEEIHDVRH